MTNWIRQAALVAAVECRLQMRTAFWRVVLVVGVILAIAMTSASLRETSRRQGEIEFLVARRDQAREQGRRVVNGFQRDEAFRAIRTPAPLSAVITGIDKRVSQYWDFGPEGITAGPAFSEESTASVATANLDLEFILRGLIGILALLAGFGSMVASRNGGPTKSLTSLPVAPSALVAGALTGGTLATAAAAAVVVVSAVTSLFIGKPEFVSSDAVWSMALVWLASSSYSAVLVAIGIAVALLVRNTARAVATVAVLWLITTTIAEPVIGAIAEGATPTRSRPLFEVSRNAEYEKALTTVESGAGDIVLRVLGATEIPVEFHLPSELLESVGRHWDDGLRNLRKRLDSLEADFWQHEVSRATTAWWLGTVLPGTALGNAVTELAGVGGADARRWSEDARSFQQALSTAVFDNRPRLHMRFGSEEEYRLVSHDRAPLPAVQDLPEFHQRLATLLGRLRDAAPSFAALTLQALAAWVAVGFIFLRRQSSPDGWH